MPTSDVINIILSCLSFLLAVISVVTVIITLKQNGKMIRNNEEQIAEMRKEHIMSLQPVLNFANPVFKIERPRLFYAPPMDEYSIQSRSYFSVEIENITSAVALNINCNAFLIIKKDEKDIVTTTTSHINALSTGKQQIHFMFVSGELPEKIYECLRETSSKKRPSIFVSIIFTNTTGGRFSVKNEYHIAMNKMEKLRNWHSIIASAEAEYKTGLDCLCKMGMDKDMFDGINDDIAKNAGDEEYIEFTCVDMIAAFKYEVISEEDYLKKLKFCCYPTYIENGEPICVQFDDNS